MISTSSGQPEADNEEIRDWRDVPDEDQADAQCTAEELARLDASRDAADRRAIP